MKMAALQLMQQKANKDSNKSDTPAITEASTETADATKAQATATDSSSATDVPTDGASQTENAASAVSEAATDGEENSSKPATNGPLDPAAIQNGECKNPLEGKELDESIPGLAQAKELAETLVAEDGSGIGTSKREKTLKSKDRTTQGELLWWRTA